MSSINCINYENKNNLFQKEITDEVRENIENLLNNGTANQLDNSWLNLILEIIPNEIEMINIRIFYFFFNNLFEKLNVTSEILKQKIQEILKKFYFELLKYSFDGNFDTILSEDIKSSKKDILKLIESPRNYIKDKIYNDYSNKTKSILDNNKFQELENNLKKMINKIPEYIEKIRENVKQVEEMYKYEEEEDAVNTEIENIKSYLLEYNNKFEELKNISFKKQISQKQIKEYENAESKIKKYKKLVLNENINEKLIYWKIPTNNNNQFNIKYDNNNIQILDDYLYFKIEELDDDFKNKFTISKNIIYKKKQKNNADGNGQTYKLELNNMIFFEKGEKIEITNYNIKSDDELHNIIISDNNLINITQHTKVFFNGLPLETIISMITDLKKILSEMKDNLSLIKEGKFENLNLKESNINYENQYKDFIFYFDIKNNKEANFSKISSIKKTFEKYLLSIKNDFQTISKKFDDKLGNISKNFSIELNKTFIPNFDMPPLPENKTYFINYDNLDSDSPLLSMPTISKKNGKLKCNYNKIIFQKGPFCPELYSKPIILNIMSLVDEEIKTEIKETPEEEIKINEDENLEENEYENDNKNDEKENIEEDEDENIKKPIKKNLEGEDKNEDENNNIEKENNTDEEKNNENNLNENINIIDRKDIDPYKYMKVKNYVQAKEPIQIEIYIPNLLIKGKKEIQKIRRILKLTAGDTCEVEIEMQILTVPIQLLFSCENYKLEFKNDIYYLNTNQLFSKEKLVFKIQNYIKGEYNKFKIRIDSLEGNSANEPKIDKEEENSFIVEMPHIEDNEVKRINCKIECFISQNYKIPIRIDSAIMPINYSFQIYDYSNHIFTANRIYLLLPTGSYDNNNYNFVKYCPENESEINLHLLIRVPFRNKATKAVIKTKTYCGYKDSSIVRFEFSKKEIEINKEKTEINCKIKVNCGNIIYSELGTLECEIEGKIQTIVIEKKDFDCNYNNIKFNEIEIFKYSRNDENDNTYNWNPIKDKNQITKEDIYICPFGLWNNKIIKYIKKYNKYNKCYYQLEPNPPDEKNLFISQDGNITEVYTKYQDYSYRHGFLWWNKTNNYPLLGKFGEKWVPLIIEYEGEEELFTITKYNLKSLENKYNSYNSYKYSLNYDFSYFLSNDYPYTYEILKRDNKLYYQIGNDFHEYLNNIVQKMSDNKILDILKKFEKKKKKIHSVFLI